MLQKNGKNILCFCGAPVRPNMLNMPKSASGCCFCFYSSTFHVFLSIFFHH